MTVCHSQGDNSDRLADDSAVMERCSEAAEYVTVDVPNSYTEDDLAEMLKNQVS